MQDCSNYKQRAWTTRANNMIMPSQPADSIDQQQLWTYYRKYSQVNLSLNRPSKRYHLSRLQTSYPSNHYQKSGLYIRQFKVKKAPRWKILSRPTCQITKQLESRRRQSQRRAKWSHLTPSLKRSHKRSWPHRCQTAACSQASSAAPVNASSTCKSIFSGCTWDRLKEGRTASTTRIAAATGRQPNGTNRTRLQSRTVCGSLAKTLQQVRVNTQNETRRTYRETAC